MDLQIKNPANCPFRSRKDTRKNNGWYCEFTPRPACDDSDNFPSDCPLHKGMKLTTRRQAKILYCVYAQCSVEDSE